MVAAGHEKAEGEGIVHLWRDEEKRRRWAGEKENKKIRLCPHKRGPSFSSFF